MDCPAWQGLGVNVTSDTVACRRLAPIRDRLEAGAQAAEQLRKQCAYRYVNLRDICNVKTKAK